LLASRRYDASRSRKTKGSLADTLQCNIWRRAQTPHRITHSLHGGDNHGRVKTDEKDAKGRSVLKDCDCAMIDCLYDYAAGRSEHVQ